MKYILAVSPVNSSAKPRMRLKKYKEQVSSWPKSGQHILAQTNGRAVIVYQAFNPAIAQYAVDNNKFGGPHYSMCRMTWIKTNFLWMMFRSDWGRAENQERVLAIHVRQEGFDKILSRAYTGDSQKEKGWKEVDVRLQWDPDHDPHGNKEVRRAIQLGLRGETLAEFNNNWIVKIEDVSDIVEEGLKLVTADKLDLLMTPEETVYQVVDKDIVNQIGLDILPSADTIESEPEKKILLSLGGSFNPVHKNHIDIMVKAKDWLEKNTDFKDVSGILVVTTENYLTKNKFRKDGQSILKTKHRLNLCNLACAPHSSWLKVHPKACVSGYDAGLTYRQKDASLLVGMVKGADKYNQGRRSHWRQAPRNSVRVDVIIGRGEVTERMEADYQEDLQAGLVQNSNYFIIPENVGNLSSTLVREVLSRLEEPGKSEQAGQELGVLMPPSGADYIIRHRDSLYIEQKEETSEADV